MGLSIEQIEHLEKGREMAKVNLEKSQEKFLKTSITDTPDMNFPSNSLKSKKIRQVTQSKVRNQKKSVGKKISELFIAEDLGNVALHVLREVILPNTKSTFLDIIITGADRLLNGENSSSKRRKYGSGPVISYGSYFKDRPDDTRYYKEHQFNTRLPVSPISRRIRQSFEDIIFDSRQDAEEVITYMVELLEEYGVVAIGEFYDMCGIQTSTIDFKYGWDNFSRVGTERIREGWIITLPTPKAL